MAERNRSESSKRWVVLGRIGAPWGVRGWVRLTSYTEPRAALLDYPRCFLRRDGDWQAATFDESRPHGKSLLGKLAGVDDRDAALTWRGSEIGVPRAELPEAGEGRYYWADLEGLLVRHRGERVLGKVAYLLATGEHDVLVVQGDRERLIPFVMNEFILGVDLANGWIDVDWEWD